MSKVGGSESKNTLYCSFCGKSQHEVRKLIAGPTVFICDECVELCMDIIREENKSSLVKSGDGVPTPVEIYEVLNDYVIGQEHAKKVLSVAVHNHGAVEVNVGTLRLSGGGLPCGEGRPAVSENRTERRRLRGGAGPWPSVPGGMDRSLPS